MSKVTIGLFCAYIVASTITFVWLYSGPNYNHPRSERIAAGMRGALVSPLIILAFLIKGIQMGAEQILELLGGLISLIILGKEDFKII